MKKVMANTCLINAILKQHIIPGVHTTQVRTAGLAARLLAGLLRISADSAHLSSLHAHAQELKSLYSKNSMLVTKKWDPKTKKNANVAWPLRFKPK